MKITLEPSETNLPVDQQHPKVSIEIPYDDCDMQQMIENLIIPALLGMGFKKETISDYFEGF